MAIVYFPAVIFNAVAQTVPGFTVIGVTVVVEQPFAVAVRIAQMTLVPVSLPLAGNGSSALLTSRRDKLVAFPAAAVETEAADHWGW